MFIPFYKIIGKYFQTRCFIIYINFNITSANDVYKQSLDAIEFTKRQPSPICVQRVLFQNDMHRVCYVSLNIKYMYNVKYVYCTGNTK